MNKTKNTALSGISWFRLSFKAIKAQPLSLTGIVIFYLLITTILVLIPFIGITLSSIWMPFGSVLVAYAARDSLNGKAPSYAPLKELFSDVFVRNGLIYVGILTVVWQLVANLIFSLIVTDEELTVRMINGVPDINDFIAKFPLPEFLFIFCLFIPLWLMTLYSPLLIARQKQTFVKSLFFSFFGFIKNFAALFTLGLLYLALAFVIYSALALIGINFAVFTFPLASIFLITLYQVGLWASYESIFE